MKTWFLLILIPLTTCAAFADAEPIAHPATRPTTAPASQSGNWVDRSYIDDSGAFPVQVITRSHPPMHLYITRIDLTDPSLQVVVAKGGEDPDKDGEWIASLHTTSQIAKNNNLDLAINANFFNCKDKRVIGDKSIPYFEGNWSKPAGATMSDGKLWSVDHFGVSLGFDKNNHALIFQFRNTAPDGIVNIVCGSASILADGKNVAPDDAPAPRTAAGLADNGKTLVLLVVDGRLKEYSAGMTFKELGTELLKQGVTDAINLDGGGSTTLVKRDKTGQQNILNRPSDGSTFFIPISIERPICVVLGFRKKHATTQP